MFILKNNPSLRRMRLMRRDFGTTCTLKGTRVTKFLAGAHYTQAQGRSMVEMLGVLAIIGVLSVGAISGYSKTMTKYKLNKQAEQLSWLLNVMYRYKDMINQPQQWISYVPYFKKLGEIPLEMIKDNSDNIYDSFGMEYKIHANGCSPICTQINLNIIMGNEHKNFDICHNIIQTSKEFAEQLGNFAIWEGESTAIAVYYGNAKCSKNSKCLKNLTQNDMYKICELCTGRKDCKFNFRYQIKD